ncbi:glyoxalase 3 [Lingula anatina]|uniref:Glyoxalase 3 n=1 Tax=Lingula anatina TaxID=7574 RepID=A0A1S3K1G4_LINAN|nr:glyoxalase 3 [Lingula anatina]|eukprot:XP_013416470.1 glyoxalase 3 [Lingula anatina]
MKALFVLTSCSEIKTVGMKTGWYLPEVAHPYEVFTKAGVQVDFVSPNGGMAPMDPGSAEAFKDDAVCKAFLANETAMDAIANTKTPAQVTPGEYKIIFYAGGHGPMFDLPDNVEIAKLATAVYEAEGAVGAVCHGTVGLIPVKLSSGELLIKGLKLTSFTDAEEKAVNLDGAMPFLLETRLKELEAVFEGADNFACNVQVSRRVVTGQNPASATKTAEELLKVAK